MRILLTIEEYNLYKKMGKMVYVFIKVTDTYFD